MNIMKIVETIKQDRHRRYQCDLMCLYGSVTAYYTDWSFSTGLQRITIMFSNYGLQTHTKL
jgi:hypothetical protein